MSSDQLKTPRRGMAVLLLAVVLAGGCQKNTNNEEGIAPSDPQVAANLVMLSRELRRALPNLHRSTNFADFAAVARVEIPPPPAGQKYAISKKWKIILVDAR